MSPQEGAMKVSDAIATGPKDLRHLCTGATATPRGIAGENKTFYFSGSRTDDYSIFGMT